MEDIVLVGFGGHAKSMDDCIERDGKFHIIGYTDIEEYVSRYNYFGTDASFTFCLSNCFKIWKVCYFSGLNLPEIHIKGFKSFSNYTYMIHFSHQPYPIVTPAEIILFGSIL